MCNRSAAQRTAKATNDERNTTSQRQLTTTTTTTTSSDGLDVQVPCSADRESFVVVRRLNTSPVDERTSGVERTLPSFVDDDNAVCRRRRVTVCRDDAAPCRRRRSVGAEPETEAGESSAHARCTAVARIAAGERDDAGRSATSPPDVAADTDVLASVAVDALAGDRSPYSAAARAAARAASTAVGDVIWQVRQTAAAAARDAGVELELSARCVVRSNCSHRQRYYSNYSVGSICRGFVADLL